GFVIPGFGFLLVIMVTAGTGLGSYWIYNVSPGHEENRLSDSSVSANVSLFIDCDSFSDGIRDRFLVTKDDFAYSLLRISAASIVRYGTIDAFGSRIDDV
ncbi:hypothetical protein Tco_1451962, partial [Tanacetum coccineum]